MYIKFEIPWWYRAKRGGTATFNDLVEEHMTAWSKKHGVKFSQGWIHNNHISLRQPRDYTVFMLTFTAPPWMKFHVVQ